MAHCIQCGAALQQGARYCANCGTAQVQPTVPPQAAPAPAPPRRKDTGGAETVILIGAVLAGLLPMAIGLGLLFFGAIFAAAIPFWGAIPASVFALFGALIFLAGAVFGAAGLWARNIVRDGEAEKGGMVAGVVGLVGCLTGNVVGGLVLIVGGLMAYTAR